MSGASETASGWGRTRQGAALPLETLPLLDEPVVLDPLIPGSNRMQWIPAAVALALLALGLLDLLPTFPW